MAGKDNEMAPDLGLHQAEFAQVGHGLPHGRPAHRVYAGKLALGRKSGVRLIFATENRLFQLKKDLV